MNVNVNLLNLSGLKAMDLSEQTLLTLIKIQKELLEQIAYASYFELPLEDLANLQESIAHEIKYKMLNPIKPVIEDFVDMEADVQPEFGQDYWDIEEEYSRRNKEFMEADDSQEFIPEDKYL